MVTVHIAALVMFIAALAALVLSIAAEEPVALIFVVVVGGLGVATDASEKNTRWLQPIERAGYTYAEARNYWDCAEEYADIAESRRADLLPVYAKQVSDALGQRADGMIVAQGETLLSQDLLRRKLGVKAVSESTTSTSSTESTR